MRSWGPLQLVPLFLRDVGGQAQCRRGPCELVLALLKLLHGEQRVLRAARPHELRRAGKGGSAVRGRGGAWAALTCTLRMGPFQHLVPRV